MRKLLIAVLTLLSLLVLCCGVAFAVDVTPPTIDFDSVALTQTGSSVGDTVTIQMSAYDDEQVSGILMCYRSPITKKSQFVHLNQSSESDMFEGSLTILDTFESGIWEPLYVDVSDEAGNSTMYASDASWGDEIQDLTPLEFCVEIHYDLCTAPGICADCDSSDVEISYT